MKKNSIILLLLISNIFIGLLYIDEVKRTDSSNKPAIKTANSSKDYPFLSKRIFTESQNDILVNFIPLRTALKQYVLKQKDALGVYFEYLPSGTSIGVNDTLEVNLASLLKVPVVMAIYKQIELEKIKKSDVLTIKKEYLDNRFGDGWKRAEGSTITVEEAIRLALVESDNTASNALLHSMSDKEINDVFDSLDIPKDRKDKFHVISAKSYSSIMRSLYLSSYLSKSSSNEILELLTKTKFNDQIPAGIPHNIPIAHKIGVFDLDDAPKTYSDCGIIYTPQRPYILCIMTNASESKAREYMSTISKMVYGYITLVKGGQ